MRRRRVAIIIVVIAVVVGIALSASVAVLNSTILLANPHIDDSLEYSADLTFAGVADVSIRGLCPSVNGSTICDLTISVALSTDGGPNFGLATKTITLKLMNSQFSQLAIASGINVPTKPLSVSYSSDNQGTDSATIYLPAVIGSATWVYDFVILNPPMTGGRAALDLIIGAQIVPTGLFGHSYDLQGEIQLPSS